MFLPRLAMHTATGKASRVYSISLFINSFRANTVIIVRQSSC